MGGISMGSGDGDMAIAGRRFAPALSLTEMMNYTGADIGQHLAGFDAVLLKYPDVLNSPNTVSDLRNLSGVARAPEVRQWAKERLAQTNAPAAGRPSVVPKPKLSLF